MSRFLSERYRVLQPYVPGEQPQNRKYVKLNTNENPFPPNPAVIEAVKKAAEDLQLYPDPDCKLLRTAMADYFRVGPDSVMLTNGSDETLYYAFLAFCDRENPALFADITYGFYPVYAEMTGVPYRELPLREDFTQDIPGYCGNEATVFIANPNAPTGIALTPGELETVLKANKDHVVVVDEAYVDFGAESCIPLTRCYENLLVIQTASKSRSMAGARLGWAIGSPELIADLNRIRYSTNPYNINRMTMAAGLATLQTDDYTRTCCSAVRANREYTAEKLQALGFEVLPSEANFLFARHPRVDGETIYLKLKERGVLVRHFTKERIRQYNRISIGTLAGMNVLLEKLNEILEEEL